MDGKKVYEIYESMSVDESPALLLKRAAEHLERQAQHFQDYLSAANDEPERIGSPVTWWVYDTVDRNAPQRAQRWVETMTPAVAGPLAAWLHAMSRFDSDWIAPKGWSNAVEFAKVVLGLSVEEETTHE